MTLVIREAGGASVAAQLLQAAGRLLGLRTAQDQTLRWTRERPPAPAYVGDAITVRLPQDRGDYTLTIEIRDRVSGAVALTTRHLSLWEP